MQIVRFGFKKTEALFVQKHEKKCFDQNYVKFFVEEQTAIYDTFELQKNNKNVPNVWLEMIKFTIQSYCNLAKCRIFLLLFSCKFSFLTLLV